MNQILVTEKIYMTPELKRKKLMYQIKFFSVIFVICLILIYYIVQEFQKHKSEQVSKSILSDITNTIKEDNTTKKVLNDVLIVELESGYDEPKMIENENHDTNEVTSYITDSGLSYTIDAILDIPSLEISYPVISETSDELLKISVNKYWGRTPNSVGNYCIVGHNYGNGNMFGKLYKMQVGDTINLTGMNNKKTVTYEVYDIYITEPEDVSCTSQLTGGKREVTLITCSNYGTQRRIIKCREKIEN